jgi:hypothetical protein
MNNELIPEPSRWKLNWKWMLPLSAFFLVGVCIVLLMSQIGAVQKERERGVDFDQEKWNAKNDQGYAYRNRMISDLIANDKLKKLLKREVIALLGQPDRIDKGYLFYRITQQRIGFLPVHTTTLVIKLDEGIVKSVMIHE